VSTAGSILAVLGLGLLAGGMVFFGAIMAPLVFTRLPPEVAGPFIRAAFPRYYGFIIGSTLLALIGLLIQGRWGMAVASAAIAGVTLWLWLGWIPHLAALREAGQQAAFDRGHRLSVWLNGAELLAALVMLARLAVV
jgi:hypothetical protein